MAQKVIALQHNGTSSFYADLSATLTAAVNGDTIYLPGGTFQGFTLDKTLVIVGVGHNPDSTIVTDRTIISGDIALRSASSGGEVWGLYINGKVEITSQNTVDGFRVSRCLLSAINSVYNNISGANANNFIISENIILSTPACYGCGSYAIGLSGSNNSILNNIVLSGLVVANSFLSNNIFTSEGTLQMFNCLIENNVINPGAGFNITTDIFHNNLFKGVNGVESSNQGSGNIIPSTSFADQFVNYSPSNDIYINDFHLTNPTYNTGGTDGTPIGIYGGLSPWKAGSIPFNPHINLKVTSSTTNNSGNLPVQIRVRAQNN